MGEGQSFIGGARVVRIDKVNGIGFIEALAGAWRTGAIAMPVDPKAPDPDIGLPIAERTHVSPGGGWVRPSMPVCAPEAPALIAFTSGTTGKPKGILLSHRALDDVTKRLIDVMQMNGSIREYVGVPVTFSFGAGRIRAVAAVGGEAYVPEGGFRPDQIAQMLAAGEINALSAVPSMLRLILAQPDLFRESGPRLRWIEIGSQYMAGAEKKSLRELFPKARIVQHYGLTEASRSTFLVVSEASDEALESVGVATGSVETRVADDGLIWIRGEHTASGQIVDGHLQPLVDGDGWLPTADLGRIEGGLLSYLGRADDVANIAGIKVSADHFEQTLLERLGEAGGNVAVAVQADALRGQRLCVATAGGIDRKRVEAQARGIAVELGLGAADIGFAEVSAIPLTETGKIQRSQLAKLVDEPMTPTEATSGKSGDTEAELAAIWREILGVSDIGPDDSFFDVGGDSLSAVTVALRAEQAGLPADILHRMFEGHSLREIGAAISGGAATPATRRAQVSNSINATRGILVLMVIGAHWLPFLYDRMGEAGAAIKHWLEPVFHIGTPGFAIIFGLGLAFFYRPLMERSPASFRKKLASNTKLLAAGVVFQGSVLMLELLVRDGRLGPIYPEQMFYSVLLFYLLMIPAVGLSLRVIYSSRRPAMGALMAAAAASLVWIFFNAVWPLDGGPGWVRLLQHMLVAPYSYPLLLSAVCVGASIGVWAVAHFEEKAFTAMAAKLGIVLLIGGIAGLAVLTPGWWSMAQTPAAFPAYAGAVALLLGGMTALVERGRLRVPVQLLAVIGLLAFPAFVGHGIVIPLVHVLEELAVPYPVALGVPVALFLGASFVAVRKLYRMLFGSTARERPALGQPFGV